MSKQDIQLFSLDNVNQEEKDFLVYMYGDDLNTMSTKKPKELAWWLKAFQAVKAGKRPSFNCPALFLSISWGIRRKGFNLLMKVLTAMLLVDSVILYFCPNVAINLGLWYGLIFAFMGPKSLINEYFSNKQLNVSYTNGRTPLIHVILPCLIFVIGSVVGDFLPLFENVPVWCDPLFYCLTTMIYIRCLMKFWLPAKRRTSEA